MKITVIGATGQSGKKVVTLLNDAGHETVAASRRSGADVLTGAGLAAAMAGDGEVRVPAALIQPVAADNAAAEVARAAVTAPINGVVNVGGPDKLAFAEMAALVLAARGEDTPVVVDPSATYFGTPLQETSLVTGAGAVIAGSRFADWLAAH